MLFRHLATDAERLHELDLFAFSLTAQGPAVKTAMMTLGAPGPRYAAYYSERPQRPIHLQLDNDCCCV
ncbi:hypothetical protein L596_010225 [Steinernema carpocapsae]|uniref:Uncharacterized protein n=1 Tax=Steinernema carpocapsae TaxID=34508 RepID=A0A4V6XWN2_STECR|nr:hypothetical protein L596_010225 [Steinernema carpocapsae]